MAFELGWRYAKASARWGRGEASTGQALGAAGALAWSPHTAGLEGDALWLSVMPVRNDLGKSVNAGELGWSLTPEDLILCTKKIIYLAGQQVTVHLLLH